MNKSIKTIFWFRQDLRISDNPGLFEAAKNGAIMPIYILDEPVSSMFKQGAASKWWLHHSLNSLNQQLDNKLNVYIGEPKTIILQIIQDNNINAIYWNRCYEPWSIKRDAEIKEILKLTNTECKSFNGSLLWEPWEILKSDGTFYKVYTPFYRAAKFRPVGPRKPLAKPKNLMLIKDINCKNNINNLKLLSNITWYKQIEPYWEIGEDAAKKTLIKFLKHNLDGYKENRNYPYKPNVSRLSPYLHFGEISPNQVWYSATNNINKNSKIDLDCFLSEIAWREFSYYLLYHFPDLPFKNFQTKFDRFTWKSNIKLLKAWQTGQTGYPIVDAGMRELWQTGYMHNRVRMIVASFLIKNLLLHWHDGEAWFWDCLVDADLASNSASWQWVAGSGADAAPYFRIFNPVTQGEKFDQDGMYTLSFVPELARLPKKYLFKPWEAPADVLKTAGIILGQTYPKPIVDLKSSREHALHAYKLLKHTADL